MRENVVTNKQDLYHVLDRGRCVMCGALGSGRATVWLPEDWKRLTANPSKMLAVSVCSRVCEEHLNRLMMEVKYGKEVKIDVS